jgi:co-chaperonin GroES (HSP10)
MKHEPQKDYMIVERVEVPKGIILPEGNEPTSDEIFRVLKVGPGDGDYKPSIKKGDLVAIVGYINTVTYKGEKLILARAKDVILKIK